MDRSYLYGDGLFETVRVHEGRVLRLDRHRERLAESGRSLGFDTETLQAGEDALTELSGKADGLWRVTVSRSPENAPFGGDGGVTVSHRELPQASRPRLMTLSGWYLPNDPLGHMKSTSYQRWIEARRRAHLAGFDDALLVSRAGEVGETSTANVFVRHGARLLTPPVRGLLDGVTRAAVVEHAHELDLVVEVRPIALAELETADEVICVSAGVLAVAARSLDEHAYDEVYAPVIAERLLEAWP